jgi:hypothetical protein
MSNPEIEKANDEKAQANGGTAVVDKTAPGPAAAVVTSTELSTAKPSTTQMTAATAPEPVETAPVSTCTTATPAAYTADSKENNDAKNDDIDDDEDKSPVPPEEEEEEERLFKDLEHEREIHDATAVVLQSKDVQQAPKLLQAALQQGAVPALSDSEQESDREHSAAVKDAAAAAEPHYHQRVSFSNYYHCCFTTASFIRHSWLLSLSLLTHILHYNLQLFHTGQPVGLSLVQGFRILELYRSRPGRIAGRNGRHGPAYARQGGKGHWQEAQGQGHCG